MRASWSGLLIAVALTISLVQPAIATPASATDEGSGLRAATRSLTQPAPSTVRLVDGTTYVSGRERSPDWRQLGHGARRERLEPSALPQALSNGLRREVLGFLNYFHLDYALERLDYKAVSTIAFFSIAANRYGHLVKRRADGSVAPTWAAWTSWKMSTIISRAHANGSRVVLAIQRFAWDSAGAADTVALLSSATRRQTLANEIAASVAQRGVDGVNLDFEPIPSTQKANYVTFVRQVRQALNARRVGYQLTFAATGYVANYDIPRLTATGAADAVYIIGYQYRGSWSKYAGSTAPLTGPIYDVTDTLNKYLTLTSASKIILGVPYYGYGWSTSSSTIHASTTGAYLGSVLYSRAVQLAAAYGTRYDTVEQSAWTVYRVRPCSTCSLQWRQVYFDNVRSLGAKYDLVNRKGLRGTGVWALGFEGSRTELYTLLKQKFGA